MLMTLSPEEYSGLNEAVVSILDDKGSFSVTDLLDVGLKFSAYFDLVVPITSNNRLKCCSGLVNDLLP